MFAKFNISEGFGKAKASLKAIADDEPKFNGYMDNAFDKFDKDKSGFIEKAELKDLVNDIVQKFKKDTDLSEDQLKKVFELMDDDKDGKISKEEFRKTSRARVLQICAS
ncbi:MAG: EF-hand domain-containing protein [archaeon]|nr:EF-hand domain-containing protein [archaeon]